MFLMRAIAAVILVLIVCSCGRSDRATDLSRFEAIGHTPDGNLWLHLTNQSHAIRLIDVEVHLDNDLLLIGDLDRWDYHLYKRFGFPVPPGEHTLRVDVTARDGGPTVVRTIQVPSGTRLHVEIEFSFQWPAEEGARIEPPKLDVRVLDAPPIPF